MPQSECGAGHTGYRAFLIRRQADHRTPAEPSAAEFSGLVSTTAPSEQGKSASTIKTDLSAIRFFHDKMSHPRYTLPGNEELGVALERRPHDLPRSRRRRFYQKNHNNKEWKDLYLLAGPRASTPARAGRSSAASPEKRRRKWRKS